MGLGRGEITREQQDVVNTLINKNKHRQTKSNLQTRVERIAVADFWCVPGVSSSTKSLLPVPTLNVSRINLNKGALAVIRMTMHQ